MPNPLPPDSLTQEEVTPYALKALESFRENALTTGEIYRVADNLAVQNGETRYMGSQLMRMTLLNLANAGTIYRREANAGDGRLGRLGQIVWLHSASNPVPAWRYDVNRQIEQHTPKPRTNPHHRGRAGRPDGPVTKPATGDGTGASGRADLIVTLVKELARDADAGLGAAALRAENARLVRANEQLVTERNDAVRKSRALERVYKTMGKLLADDPDTSG